MLNDLLHPVELPEGRVEAQNLVGEDAGQARIQTGIHEFRFADGHQHALGRSGVGGAVGLAQFQIILDGQLFLFCCFKARLIRCEDTHLKHSFKLSVGWSGPRVRERRNIWTQNQHTASRVLQLS